MPTGKNEPIVTLTSSNFGLPAQTGGFGLAGWQETTQGAWPSRWVPKREE